jgi:hypothetical protein
MHKAACEREKPQEGMWGAIWSGMMVKMVKESFSELLLWARPIAGAGEYKYNLYFTHF